MPDQAYMRRCAVFYADRLKLPVFPLHPVGTDGRCAGCGGEKCAGKHPLTPRWEQTLASRAAAESAWRPGLGERGIGMACGARAGVWVLDVDLASGGLETLARLEAIHGHLPETWRSRTGTGGFHVFFRDAEGRVRNSASSVEKGLDIRGSGGFVVLPPSMHRSGHEYSWIDAPLRAPLADAPGWLSNLALMRPVKDAAKRRNGNGNGNAPASLKLIAAGRRHDALVRFCGLLRSCGLGEDAIVECGHALLRHHAVKAPAMDLEQAERDMRDVARRYAPTPPEVS